MSLKHQYGGLEPHPGHEAYAEGWIYADSQHVLRAAKEVERERQPRCTDAQDVRGLQGLPDVGSYAVNDLRYPETAMAGMGWRAAGVNAKAEDRMGG